MKRTPYDLALLNRTLRHPYPTTEDLGWVAAFLETCEELQPNMAPKEDDRATWLRGLSAIRISLKGRTAPTTPDLTEARFVAEIEELPADLFTDLQRIAEAAWAGPAASEHQLPFMVNPELRRIAQRDLGSLLRMRSSEVVKAALILAGSAMEAILLDVLEQDVAAATAAASKVKLKRMAQDGRWKSFQSGSIKDWSLHQMIAVCGPDGLGILAERTENCAGTVRDYRNLVHPREEREEMLRSPILSSEGAVASGLLEQVVEQVKIWCAKKGHP